MNKTDFLQKLNQKLNLIADEERKDILMEYGTYIDDKMAEGFTEEEAVSGFGDLDELAHDILEAYKINTDNVHTRVDKTLDNVYARSENFLNRVGNLSVNDISHILFDGLILLLIIAVGKVVVIDIFFNLFISLLFSFTGFYLVENFLLFVLTLVYYILALVFFVSVMSRRINRYKNKASIRQVGVIEDIKNTWNQETRDFIKSENVPDDLPPLPKQQKPLYHQRVQMPKVNRTTMGVFGKTLIILCGIPVTCALIGFCIVFIMMIYVSIVNQATSIGLYILFAGLIGGSVSILWLLAHIWPKKEVDENA